MGSWLEDMTKGLNLKQSGTFDITDGTAKPKDGEEIASITGDTVVTKGTPNQGSPPQQVPGKKKPAQEAKKPETPRDDSGVRVATQSPHLAEEIWIPSHLKRYRSSFCWLHFMARPIERQASWARSDKPVEAGGRRFEFYFLAPMEMQEILSHEWGPYETIAAKIAEKAALLGRAGAEWENLKLQKENLKQLFDKNKLLSGLDRAMGTLRQGGYYLSQAAVRQQRVDTAMVYKNTERRKFDFIFHLAPVPESTNLYKDVLYPVKLLQYLSSPTKTVDTEEGGTGRTSLADVKPPWFFTIKSYPIDFMSMEYAACVMIQPTYRGPYIEGMPSVCELQISFQEIPPLWDEYFLSDRRITVGAKTGDSLYNPRFELGRDAPE